MDDAVAELFQQPGRRAQRRRQQADPEFLLRPVQPRPGQCDVVRRGGRGPASGRHRAGATAGRLRHRFAHPHRGHLRRLQPGRHPGLHPPEPGRQPLPVHDRQDIRAELPQCLSVLRRQPPVPDPGLLHQPVHRLAAAGLRRGGRVVPDHHRPVHQARHVHRVQRRHRQHDRRLLQQGRALLHARGGLERAGAHRHADPGARGDGRQQHPPHRLVQGPRARRPAPGQGPGVQRQLHARGQHDVVRARRLVRWLVRRQQRGGGHRLAPDRTLLRPVRRGHRWPAAGQQQPARPVHGRGVLPLPRHPAFRHHPGPASAGRSCAQPAQGCDMGVQHSRAPDVLKPAVPSPGSGRGTRPMHEPP